MQNYIRYIKFISIAISIFILLGCQTSSDIQATKSKNQAIKLLNDSIKSNAALRPSLKSIPESLRDNLNPVFNNTDQPEKYTLNIKKLPLDTAINNIAALTGKNIIVSEDAKDIKVTLILQSISFDDLMRALKIMYGLHIEYKNNVYFIKPPTIITRFFVIDYLNIKGIDDMEDIGTYHESIQSGGQLLENNTRSDRRSNNNYNNNEAQAINKESGIKKLTLDSEQRLKKHENFWSGLHLTILSIISNASGGKASSSSVNIDPFSGMITVQTYSYVMPKVEEYINKLQKRVQRQVLIKAKIVEIDSSQGLDTDLDISDLFGVEYEGSKNEFKFDFAKTGFSDFKATLQLLGKFGKTTVLSNPIISTLNNHKAQIRVGEFEYFSTGETTNIIPVAAGSSSIQTQDIELEPYFSGIALGVTPQISDDGHIMMKIMPSINHVTQQDVKIEVPSSQGSGSTSFVIPTAKTELREAETMVRVKDGEIIIIGGLTQDGARINRSGFPGVGYDGTTQREELSWRRNNIILLQPTIVTNGNWSDTLKAFQKKISDN